jgi:hypothetical protein
MSSDFKLDIAISAFQDASSLPPFAQIQSLRLKEEPRITFDLAFHSQTAPRQRVPAAVVA